MCMVPVIPLVVVNGSGNGQSKDQSVCLHYGNTHRNSGN